MLTVGSDAEVFLRDGNGNLVASCGKFGGTKERPKNMFPIDWSNPKAYADRGFMYQEDNVALEFNIPAAKTQDEFIAHMKRALGECERLAKEKGLVVVVEAANVFPESELQTKAAQEFGCEPDFSVWSLKPNPRPKADNPNLRTASAHIHVGYPDMDRVGFGRAMDLFLGAPSVVLDPDRKRRELYGKAGCIRMKPYGLEYRTLSNFWLKDKLDWVYQQVEKVVEFVKEKRVIDDDTGMMLIHCINNFDMGLLRHLTKEYNLKY